MTRGITAKKLVRYGSIILLFIVIVGYGLWRSRDLLFGIRLSISGIKDGMTATDPLLSFSGTAYHAKAITVNLRPVSVAENGTWGDTIALLPGYNIVTVSVTDKFGRVISKNYRLYYTAPPPPAASVLPDTAPKTETPAGDSAKNSQKAP